MTTSHDLQQLAEQSRRRIDQIRHLRAEQRLINTQTAQRLRDSRLLLERSSERDHRAPCVDRWACHSGEDGDSAAVEDEDLQARLDAVRRHVAEQRERLRDARRRLREREAAASARSDRAAARLLHAQGTRSRSLPCRRTRRPGSRSRTAAGSGALPALALLSSAH